MPNIESESSGITDCLEAIEATAVSMRDMAETVGRLEAAVDALQSEQQALREALLEAVAAAETSAASARSARENAERAQMHAKHQKAVTERIAAALAHAMDDHRKIADALAAGFGHLPALER